MERMERMQAMQRFIGRFRHGFGRRVRLDEKQPILSHMKRFVPGFRHRFERRVRPGEKQLTLAQMEAGQSGTIVEIQSGHRLTRRLNALGIRPGLIVTKVSSMFMRGPVTIQTGNSQVAIGHGMANRVIVEPRES